MKIIKVYATWCGPCKVLGKMLDNSGIVCENIDIDTDFGEEFCTKYDIKSVPTLIVFDDEDNELRRLVGFPKSVESLKEFIQNGN